MSYNKVMFEKGSKRSIIREIFEYSKKRSQTIGGDKVFDFSLGNPNVPPPNAITDCIKNLLESADSTLLHGYTSAQGDFNVRKTVADSIQRRFGTAIEADNIYMTCGAAASLSIVLKAIINSGDECIVFAPFFTEYTLFIESAGGKVVVSDPLEKSFQIDIADFEQRITPSTKAIIINSPNNPCGVVYSEETLSKVCAILKKRSEEYGSPIYLIADEPYREIVYDNLEVPYLMNYYDNTFVCYSYSKSLSLPGERIGYIAVSPTMQNSAELYLAVCGGGRSLGYVCAPSLFQQVVARCIDVNVDVSIYKENRDILYNGLTDMGYECVKPDGAFYLFVKALEPDANAFFERAKSHELLLVPSNDFGVTGYVRIAYCVDRATIVNSLPAFKALAEEYGL